MEHLGWDLLRDLSPTLFVWGFGVYAYFVVIPMVMTGLVILQSGNKMGFAKCLITMALSVLWAPFFALFGPLAIPFLIRQSLRDEAAKHDAASSVGGFTPPSWLARKKRMKLVREKLNGGTHSPPPGAA